jgi:hypothetical protein
MKEMQKHCQMQEHKRCANCWLTAGITKEAEVTEVGGSHHYKVLTNLHPLIETRYKRRPQGRAHC